MDEATLKQLAKDRLGVNECNVIEAAISYATTKHLGQKRASGEDYITHPLAVAAILLGWKLDLDSVVAGILHDTVEDTAASLEEIEAEFGPQTAFLVDGVTKITAIRSGMRNIESYLPQTRDNLSKLLLAIGQDARVILIKLADRLHNLRTLEYLPAERQQKIAAESLEIFARLADRMGMGEVRVEMEEIAFSYLQPKRYQHLKRLSKKRLTKAHARFETVKQEVSQSLDQQAIAHSIDGRIKSIYSLHRKLVKYNDNMEDVHDFMAIRVIVENEADCYRVLGILHNLYKPLLHRIKDYISTPKPNGYQSLHTTVQTADKQIVEFQVRTKRMHDFAEHGFAASFNYHEQKQHKDYALRRGAPQSSQQNIWLGQLQNTARAIKAGMLIEDLKVDFFGDRIFVYSPNGDIYDLPEGAFPLDYAYAVHSDIGNQAHTFIVNGTISKFGQQLQNGDVVEVRTNKNTRPKADWIKFAKTSKARQKIKSTLQEST